MRRLLDSIIVLVVTLFVVNALLEMFRPHALAIIITVVVILLAGRALNRYRSW